MLCLCYCYFLQLKKIEDARTVYERLVAQFPNAGRYWKIFIEHEVSKIHFLCFQNICKTLLTSLNFHVERYYTACLIWVHAFKISFLENQYYRYLLQILSFKVNNYMRPQFTHANVSRVLLNVSIDLKVIE